MDRISQRHSPQYIMIGKHDFYDKHCTSVLGEYCQPHESQWDDNKKYGSNQYGINFQ